MATAECQLETVALEMLGACSVNAPMEVGQQMQTIPNQAVCGKVATRKRNRKVGIILGCQRMTGTWSDVCCMARDGQAVIRDGRDVRLVWSEAFEVGGYQ